jgi:rubrerythrin
MGGLDLASPIELEAKKRYTEFAESLGSRGVDDAVVVFRSMAVNKTRHRVELRDVVVGYRILPSVT